MYIVLVIYKFSLKATNILADKELQACNHDLLMKIVFL